MRAIPALLLLAACEPAGLEIGETTLVPGSGWADEPWATWGSGGTEAPDTTRYDGASIEVLLPRPGAFLEYGAAHTFEAQVTDLQGSPLPIDDVEWTSDSAPNWFETGPIFETSGLPIGMHAFTAKATLPNGAVVQHTVGGVYVQHANGGTYAGLLDVDGTVLNLPLSCIGVTLIVVDEFGEDGVGDGDCLVSILGLDVPLHILYELEIDAAGNVSGTAGVDLIGWFTYNFAAAGTLDPDGVGFDVTFDGDVPLLGPLSGATTAERISLDSQ